MNRLVINISGMHCAACVSRVEQALRNAEGVTDASVNLILHRATVTANGSATEQSITAAVTGAGYAVERIYDADVPPIAADYEQRLRSGALEYKRAFLTALPFAAAVMCISMWSMFVQHIHHINGILFVLTLPVMWSGRTFFQGAVRVGRGGTATMDTLVTLGTWSAFLVSVVLTIAPWALPSMQGAHGAYYDSAATIIALVLLGKWMEQRAKRSTADAITTLLALTPKTVRVLRHTGGIEDVDIHAVAEGDSVVLRPGEIVPIDGIITEGASSFNESAITGESLPVDRGVGDRVVAGTLNTTGSVVILATAVGGATVLSSIIRAVERAQSSKAPVQRLADSISAWFVPVVLAISVGTLLGWLLLSNNPDAVGIAISSAISVLIIACPCALGLATPAAIIVGSGKGASRGILFANAASLEALSGVNTVVFDKTGTLTHGKPTVVDASTNADENTIKTYVHALAQRSEHPIAHALVLWSNTANIDPSLGVEMQTTAGLGMMGIVGGTRVRIGSEAFMSSALLVVPAQLMVATESYANLGYSTVFVAVNASVCAVVAIADEVRPESARVVHRLHQRGIRTIMATGDRERSAARIAASVGITEVFHSILPDQKASMLQKLQEQGSRVAMVGDGINDAPALAQAEVGITLGAATDAAKSAAGVTLLRNNIETLLDAFDISRETLRTIRQNLFFAFVYNVLGIPLAAGLLQPLWGVTFSPMVAALAMSLSSVTVLSNALRMRVSR